MSAFITEPYKVDGSVSSHVNCFLAIWNMTKPICILCGCKGFSSETGFSCDKRKR